VRHRSDADGLIEAGNVRLNRNRVSKAGQNVKTGDVLTLTLYSGVKIIRVLGEAERRGPASAAQALYEDLTPTHAHHATPEIPGAIAK
jgi:ribosome-associated heat shock protein Hsp15